jgi:hypothetical protein
MQSDLMERSVQQSTRLAGKPPSLVSSYLVDMSWPVFAVLERKSGPIRVSSNFFVLEERISLAIRDVNGGADMLLFAADHERTTLTFVGQGKQL